MLIPDNMTKWQRLPEFRYVEGISHKCVNEMETITYRPIGIIHSPWKTEEGMPIQPRGAAGTPGTVLVYEEYLPGLKDIEGFSRIYLIYHFHRSKGYDLTLTPFLDTTPHGVFATRAPRRPNHIGISLVRLVGCNQSGIDIEDVDIIDGTPLLDIKPYVSEFDSYPGERTGWFPEKSWINEVKSDRRFAGQG
jgi:tRNA (adenine37-N6)-methyltransferase